MRRRDLLKAATAAAVIGAAPRIGRADRANTLVFVGVADLSVFDPVVTGARPTRNAAYLVFDTLYGLDTSWKAQPQMVEGHTAEADGLTWRLTLREGLRFHDNEPVLARDVVASIRRFAPRVNFAAALIAAIDDLSAADDRTVQFRLKRAFPHLPEALAGPGGNVPVIMPERLTAESPFKPVAEVVGSGPYRFVKDEYLSGARSVFRRFEAYRPRDGGPVGFTAGPKVAHFDRDQSNWRDDIGLFGTGTPFATDVGVELLRRPRDYIAVQKALKEAGYKGEKIVVIAPTNVHELGDLTRTGAEQLRRAGMTIDLQEMDFATVIRRRNSREPPDKGGYNMFCTLIDRSLPNVHPFGNLAIRADGKEPINGWANSPKIEELRAAWLDAADFEQQKQICIGLQKQMWADVPFIPMGEYWQATAYRKKLTDVVPGCFATFYGVRQA